MVQEGDEVTIQSGMFSGKQGEVREIDRDRGIVTVAVEGFGAERETRVPLGDVAVAGEGDADEMWETVDEMVREAVRQPFAARRNLWWAERAERGEQASPELLDEFADFREELDADYDETVEEELDAIRDDLEGADATRLQSWLAGAADDVERRWRERAEEARREFLEDVVPDDQLERMQREAVAFEEDDDLLDEQAQKDRATGRLASELVDEGLRLWEKCQEQKSLEEAKGYQWASVAPGPVDLTILPPEDERPEGDEVEAEDWTLPGEPSVWRTMLEQQLAALSTAGAEWRGLETRSGTGEPIEAAPWEIDGADGLTDLLERVWGPLAERMPNACEAIYERCLAAAELETDQGPMLAYLMVRPVQDAGRQAVREQWGDQVPYQELIDYTGEAGLPTILLGAAPDDTVDVKLEDDSRFSLPMGLRELRARHGILRAPMLVLGGSFETLIPSVDDAAAFRQANDGAAPDRFVAFGEDRDDNRQVFDRDDLDMRHDPTAAGWDRDSGEVGKRHPFWLYVDAMIRGMIGMAVS